MAESTRVKAINAAIANDRSILDEARTAREQAVAQGARAREIQRAASRDARQAQAEYKAASDLLKSTPGGLEAVMKYQAGGYGAPSERGVNFYDRAPDIGRDLQQLQQEAREQLRETMPVADYMKYQSFFSHSPR